MAKLLIVDDERKTRDGLRETIAWQMIGVRSVRTARNGVEALALAEEDPPDVLVTDVRMPKMDGIELAERVRKLFPHCKIVFLSGYADKDYLKTAIRLQAVRYIEKPIDPAELTGVVSEALSLQHQETRAAQEVEKARRSLEENRRLLGRELAAALVRGGLGKEDLRRRFGESIPSFEPGTAFTVAVVRVGAGGKDRAADKGPQHADDKGTTPHLAPPSWTARSRRMTLRAAWAT